MYTLCILGLFSTVCTPLGIYSVSFIIYKIPLSLSLSLSLSLYRYLSLSLSLSVLISLSLSLLISLLLYLSIVPISPSGYSIALSHSITMISHTLFLGLVIFSALGQYASLYLFISRSLTACVVFTISLPPALLFCSLFKSLTALCVCLPLR